MIKKIGVMLLMFVQAEAGIGGLITKAAVSGGIYAAKKTS
ncbi:hypothetical protein AGMMS5026_02990 [Endomicrobiia bacterium]|nr:hypothetical protein AGMMS49523_06670 [Endomicrobiia bacterium]GHT13441.1 hypothetical protein AGMMS49571_07170 [Endomicrobiia bacterium]GHT20851.1 hypothetical protein AGMMS49929_08540 [Endomicrobiia bacterium]GHT28078.1 hypothetical protein AGMMS49995_08240 [Endomicrobiia bacterium]GHT30010.1 hypothetical protein AGMMS5026_02990 [Endomicrobiia bacterium]